MPDDVLNLDAIFDDSFKEAIAGKPFEPEEKPAEEKPVEEKPAEEKPAEEKPAEEKPAEEKPLEEKPVEEKPVETKPVEDPRISKLEAELAELKTKAAEPAKAEEKKPEVSEPLPDIEPEKWDKVKKEWQDLGGFIEELNTVNRKRFEMQLSNTIKMFAGELEQYLAPLFLNASETVEDRYTAGILEKHKDALDLLPEVENWVKTLPPWQKKAADAILDGGSVKETISLYDEFKKATGRTTEEKKPEETKSEPVKKVVSEKAKLMEGVKDTRTGVARTEDPNDFDAAFKEAVKVV